MSRKTPTNLLQQRAQSHHRTFLQQLTSFSRLCHSYALILSSHTRQDWSFTPTHTPITQLNPNGHILHSFQPRRSNSKRCNQRDIQSSILCSLHIQSESRCQVPESKAGCRSRCSHRVAGIGR